MFSPIYKPFLIFQSSEEDLPAEPIDAEQKSKQLRKKFAVQSKIPDDKKELPAEGSPSPCSRDAEAPAKELD